MSSWDLHDELTALIEKALKNLAEACQLPSEAPREPIFLETPKLSSHGDIATNLAMRLSQKFGLSGLEMASRLADFIKDQLSNSLLKEHIARVEAQPPGFVNFFLSKAYLYEVLREIQTKTETFGKKDSKRRGQKLQIEFVSANPTGPLSLAHGRQAAVGDTLAKLFEFTGDRVTREYFINDEGKQIELLGASIRARYMELLGQESEFPREGYRGKYIYKIAQSFLDKYGNKFQKQTKKSQDFFIDYGCNYILELIKKDLHDFGVIFDVWTSQAALRQSGKIKNALGLLEKKDLLYKKDGALWFKSASFGDDKDRVLVKSDGNLTYLGPDIAYHRDKFRRGFKRVINIWGPDHHGYIPRLKAAVQALGISKDDLAIIIVQLTTLYRGKQMIPMSTRAGEFVTLRQIIEEVGKDAARFFFLMRRVDSHLDFDLELAKRRSLENPVYYIQYAHARICNILEFARKQLGGKGPFPSPYPSSQRGEGRGEGAKLSILNEPQEIAILRRLRQFPQVVTSCCLNLEPYGLAPYLQGLASDFHSFYDRHRVVTDDLPLSRARLVLVDCVRIVLAKGLSLMGICAPQKM